MVDLGVYPPADTVPDGRRLVGAQALVSPYLLIFGVSSLRAFHVLLTDRSLSFYYCHARINRGRGRVIPKQRLEGVKIHRTVKLRMEMKKDGDKLYKPMAGLIKGITPTWVD